MSDKLGLYQAKDYYGICIWRSVFHQRMKYEKGNKYDTQIQNKILSLKRNGNSKGFVWDIAACVKDYFNCNSIAVIPSSKEGFSNLQVVLHNYVFKRTKQVPSRKYQYGGGVGLTDGVDVNLSDVKGKVLLIDDVITTGITINAFAKKLKDFEYVKFGIAINHKLKPIQIDEIERQWDDNDILSDLDVNEYEMDLKDITCQELS